MKTLTTENPFIKGVVNVIWGKLIYGRKASLVAGFMFDQKDKFIEREILGLTIQGAVQHIKTYKDNDGDVRVIFREKVHSYLTDFENEYKSRVDSEKHIANIERLRGDINQNSDVVKEGGISFGVAQKLLNLYLKYYWCLARVKEPPHCPVDAMILEAVGMNRPPWQPWSQMSSAQYREVIEAIEKNKGSLSIAYWELETWIKQYTQVGKNRLPVIGPRTYNAYMWWALLWAFLIGSAATADKSGMSAAVLAFVVIWYFASKADGIDEVIKKADGIIAGLNGKIQSLEASLGHYKRDQKTGWEPNPMIPSYPEELEYHSAKKNGLI